MENKSKLYVLLGGLAALFCIFFPIAAATFQPSEITIAWDANTGEKLAGYAIYVKNSPDEPFRLLDDLYLDELQDPANPMVTLTELEDDSTYYFAVTAFDEEGHESNYSREVCAQVEGASITRCSSGDSRGGGGGGCFISTAGG